MQQAHRIRIGRVIFAAIACLALADAIMWLTEPEKVCVNYSPPPMVVCHWHPGALELHCMFIP